MAAIATLQDTIYKLSSWLRVLLPALFTWPYSPILPLLILQFAMENHYFLVDHRRQPPPGCDKVPEGISYLKNSHCCLLNSMKINLKSPLVLAKPHEAMTVKTHTKSLCLFGGFTSTIL